jgi:hypothetical protein
LHPAVPQEQQQSQPQQQQLSSQHPTPSRHVAILPTFPVSLAANSSPTHGPPLTPGGVGALLEFVDKTEREATTQRCLYGSDVLQSSHPLATTVSSGGASDTSLATAPATTSASHASGGAPLPCGQADQPSQ